MSLNLLILRMNTTFEDLQMMLKWFFYFSTAFGFSTIIVECSFHICSCLWLAILVCVNISLKKHGWPKLSNMIGKGQQIYYPHHSYVVISREKSTSTRIVAGATTSCATTRSHCVLLEHYYSVDFPWWFDRKISFFSLLSKTC